MQIKLSISPSHGILTPGGSVLALTLYRQAPGRVPTEVPIFCHWYDSTPEKSRRKRDSNPESSAFEADALTTRPARRSSDKSSIFTVSLRRELSRTRMLKWPRLNRVQISCNTWSGYHVQHAVCPLVAIRSEHVSWML